jgi:hypothetical protein
MKTNHTFRAAVVAIVAAASAVVVACSGDDNNGNPQPTVDSGMQGDSTMPMGDDSSMPGTDSSMVSDSTTPPIDTGACKSDGGTCNSCYTAMQAMQDPYNACNAYTSKCIPFDPSRVPSHPQL